MTRKPTSITIYTLGCIFRLSLLIMVTSLRCVSRSREEVERDPQHLPRLPGVPHCPCRHVYDRYCAFRQAYLCVLIFSKETNPHLARLNFPPLGFVMAWIIKKSLTKPEQLLVDEIGLRWVTHNTPFILVAVALNRSAMHERQIRTLLASRMGKPASKWGTFAIRSKLVPRLSMRPNVLGWWIVAWPGHWHFAAYYQRFSYKEDEDWRCPCRKFRAPIHHFACATTRAHRALLWSEKAWRDLHDCWGAFSDSWLLWL